jgi:hypothetical protein
MMIPSSRYVLAVVINVGLPTAAYKMAFPHYGLQGALIASSVPLLVWVALDYIRFEHFDARSALVLSGIAVSLVVSTTADTAWFYSVREPLVSGFIGTVFLISLLLERPLVFYLARSTLARERVGLQYHFDIWWQTRRSLVKSIRLMTVVWGTGLVAENAIRLYVAACLTGPYADRISALAGYSIYAGLLVWTLGYRQFFLKRQGYKNVD